MSSHGKQIMQAVTLILEAEHSIEVKEQVSALCFMLTNGFYTEFILQQSRFNILQSLCLVRHVQW